MTGARRPVAAWYSALSCSIAAHRIESLPGTLHISVRAMPFRLATIRKIGRFRDWRCGQTGALKVLRCG